MLIYVGYFSTLSRIIFSTWTVSHFFCPLLLDDSDWVTILLDFWGSIRYENGLPPISPDQYEWLIIISRHDFKYVKLYNDVKCFFLGTISPQFPTNPIFSGDSDLDKLPIPFSAAILELISYPSQPCSGLVPGAEKHRDNVGVLRPKSGRGVMRDVLGMFDEFWDKVKWRYATNLGVQFH